MEEVKLDYLESLRDLTFNSRPIIQGLTTIAAESVDYASAIVQAVNEHVSRAPSQLKLPAMYLMDSIVKNVTNPYADLFAPHVYRMFTDAFSAVPEPVRVKFGELFQTWTQEQPKTGHPLFHDEILRQIDAFLVRASRKPQEAGSSTSGRLNASGLQVEVHRMLNGLKTDDKDTDYQRSALTRLQTMLASPLDPSALLGIQQQIEALRNRASYATRVPGRSRSDQGRDRRQDRRDHDRSRREGREFRDQKNNRDRHNDWDRRDRGRDRDRDRGAPFATGANSVELQPRTRRFNDDTPETDTQSFDAAQESSTGIVGSSATPVLPANLLKSLKSAGLLANLDSIGPGGYSSYGVDLTNASLEKPHPELVAKLYDDLPLQSAITGKRFPDTPTGRQAQRSEADWQFRVNKSIKDGKSFSRVWYLAVDAWVLSKEDLTDTDYIEPEAKEIDYTALAKQYIPVPADPGTGMCPICQEKFSTVWSEDAEEWVWIDAVDVEGHIFNATCYADPQNAAVIDQIMGRTETYVKPEVGGLPSVDLDALKALAGFLPSLKTAVKPDPHTEADPREPKAEHRMGEDQEQKKEIKLE